MREGGSPDYKPVRILVCIPIKPNINPQLRKLCETAADRMPGANPRFHLIVQYFEEAIPKEPGDSTPWSRVTRARNRMLRGIDLHSWDYLLWIDADVVDYPADLPQRLYEANPEGIAAPMVFVEGTAKFYDYAAFIELGRDYIAPTVTTLIPGRNLRHDAPYWSTSPSQKVVPVACVGTVTLVPTWVYQMGARYEDHPSFTDHYSICKFCRDAGKNVVVVRDVAAFHADLPKYGEAWH